MKNKIRAYIKKLFNKQYMDIAVVKELNKKGIGVYF